MFAWIVLPFAIVISAACVPLIAAFSVWRVEGRRASVLGSWFGLSVGWGMATTGPLVMLQFSLVGHQASALYGYAWLVGAVSLALGVCIIREHKRRLDGVAGAAPWLALGCVAFAWGFAILHLPWVIGAPLPIGGGWFLEEIFFAGGPADYARQVLPIVGLLSIESAVLLLGEPRRLPRLAVAIGGSLALLTAAIALRVLPGSRWDALAPQVALRAGRAALLKGEVAQPSAAACPAHVHAKLASLADWQAYVTAPRDWFELQRHSAAVARVESISEGSSDTFYERPAPATTLEAAWQPWRLPAPEPAIDAIFITREYADQGFRGTNLDLGRLRGELWIWSSTDRAYVCAAPVTLAAESLQAAQAVDAESPAAIAASALRMRAMAVAASTLLER